MGIRACGEEEGSNVAIPTSLVEKPGVSRGGINDET